MVRRLSLLVCLPQYSQLAVALKVRIRGIQEYRRPMSRVGCQDLDFFLLPPLSPRHAVDANRFKIRGMKEIPVTGAGCTWIIIIVTDQSTPPG